jgi:riboflavin synthase
MFTGLVSDVGTVERLTRSNGGLRLRIRTGYDVSAIADGASIACAGVCLTVVETSEAGEAGWFDAEAVPETLSLTTLGDIAEGDRINLERPLRAGDELGGHSVLGHVDGIAEIIGREDDGDSVRLTLRAPKGLSRYIARKGSVTLDGTSLTVTWVEGDDFAVALIPHTLDVTTWGDRRPGNRVNLEIDVLARYMERLVATMPTAEAGA